MSAMVDRIARAIWEVQFIRSWDSTSEDDPNKKDMKDSARAALKAMMITNPVEGVPGGIAFEDAFFGEQNTVFHSMRDAWNATISSALVEGDYETKKEVFWVTIKKIDSLVSERLAGPFDDIRDARRVAIQEVSRKPDGSILWVASSKESADTQENKL